MTAFVYILNIIVFGYLAMVFLHYQDFNRSHHNELEAVRLKINENNRQEVK